MTRGTVDFNGKVILAPMVRIGTLPARLMALEYGADLVYTHEVIDHKILNCDRIQNDLLGTIDYVLPDKTVVLRTCSQETEKLIFQVGTCSSERALKVAEKIQYDVAGIDVNMGCPKEFSLKGGMGAALLKQPDKIRDILTTLVQNAPKHLTVTCKIRILPSVEETVTLARLIENTGVNALAVHGRLTAERPRHPNHNDVIRAVAAAVKIPVIANGGSRDHIQTYGDIERFRLDTGAAAVMIARTAMWNLSIFRKTGLIPLEDVLPIYLRKAVDYDFCITNVKYCMQNMLHEQMETPRGKALLSAATVREICELWNLDSHYDDRLMERSRVRERAARDSPPHKRARADSIVMDLKVTKKDYDGALTPKQLLYEYTTKQGIDHPAYDTIYDDKRRVYSSVCRVGACEYATSWTHMSKKFVEQASAAVALRSLGQKDGLVSRPEHTILHNNKNGTKLNQHSDSSVHSLHSQNEQSVHTNVHKS